MRLATDELAQLNGALGESGERILLLETLLAERDSRLRETNFELEELRDATGWLSSQLDSMISLNERLASGGDGSTTTGGLKSATSGDAGSECLDAQDAMGMRSQLIDQLRELRLRTRARTRATEMKLFENRRRGANKKRVRINGSGSPTIKESERDGDDSVEDDDDQRAETEAETGHDRQKVITTATTIGLDDSSSLASSIYKLLKQFQAQLERRRAELHWRQQQLLANNSNHATQQQQQQHQQSATSTTGNSSGEPNANHQQPPTAATTTFSSSSGTNSSVGADDSGISAAFDDNTSSTSGSEHDNTTLNFGESEVRDPARWQSMLAEIRLLVDDLVSSLID